MLGLVFILCDLLPVITLESYRIIPVYTITWKSEMSDKAVNE